MRPVIFLVVALLLIYGCSNASDNGQQKIPAEINKYDVDVKPDLDEGDSYVVVEPSEGPEGI